MLANVSRRGVDPSKERSRSVASGSVCKALSELVSLSGISVIPIESRCSVLKLSVVIVGVAAGVMIGSVESVEEVAGEWRLTGSGATPS